MPIVSRNTRLIRFHGELIEFAAYPEHAAWYEAGTGGRVGALHAPMLENGEPDIENIAEIEVRYEDA